MRLLAKVVRVEVLDLDRSSSVVLNDLVGRMESTTSNDIRDVIGSSLLDGDGICVPSIPLARTRTRLED